MRYDVIVVGAGPAGSTTARECAHRGLSVLMLDKAEFPRDKPCGGGVTVRAASLLPFDISPVVEKVATGAHISYRRSRGFVRRSDRPLVYLTQRCRLDAFLVERALEAGAELRERTPVREVELFPSRVVVRAGGAAFEGRTLVAADGANGRTAALAGIQVNHWRAVALEGNVTPANGVPPEWHDLIGVNLGGIPGGYGWVFPKRDHLNIGLGGWQHVAPSMRERLQQLVSHYGFDAADLWGIKGHYLPVRRAGSPLAAGNVVLVGDAAGLIDPMTAEGIYSAFWSGRAAGRHLAAFVKGEVESLEGYRQEVEEQLMPDLRVSHQLHDLFHLMTRFYFGAERRTSVVWKAASRILRGEQTYAGVMQKHPRFSTAIEFASDLVRVSPLLQRISGLREPAPPQRFFLNGGRPEQDRP